MNVENTKEEPLKVPEYDVIVDEDTPERVKQISELIQVLLNADKYNLSNCIIYFNDFEIKITRRQHNAQWWSSWFHK